ncbi:MAG: tetratricopeptide repeat protein [Ruminococcus sp.]|nr:tetratricopeptide repeat protein [Ruminococcus sp.]
MEKSLELDPDSGYIYDNLGELLLETGKYEEAVVQFSRAIELGCNEIETYEKRAKSYEAIGETEKAKADKEMSEKLKADQGDSDDSD